MTGLTSLTGTRFNGSSSDQNDRSQVILAFPTHQVVKRKRDIHSVVPLRRCKVLPLRRDRAAKNAALLIGLRLLHAEIEAINASREVQIDVPSNRPQIATSPPTI